MAIDLRSLNQKQLAELIEKAEQRKVEVAKESIVKGPRENSCAAQSGWADAGRSIRRIAEEEQQRRSCAKISKPC
jgi:hypothetical protein